MNWYIQVLHKYAEFNGRACRAEYWMFFLFNLIIALVLFLIEAMIGSYGIIATLYSLAVLVPGIAVTVRRLHDSGRSGWWILIVFVPLIGTVILLIFLVFESQPGANEYGPNPSEGPATAV